MTQSHFFALPRELRDAIYDQLLSTAPLPAIPDERFMAYSTSPCSTFRKIYDAPSAMRGEFGCAYSLAPIPSTCASFIACSRQANKEMEEARERLERKKEVCARLDCLAMEESWHYFTLVSMPLVSTSPPPAQSLSLLPPWLCTYVALFLGSLLPWGTVSAPPASTTCIPRLWVDVRLAGTRKDKYRRASSPAGRTGWAICAALKRLLFRGPELAADHGRPSTSVVCIDELVLNVVPPCPAPNGAPAALLDEDFPLDGDGEGTVHPRTVAQELVSVWGKIWAGDEFRGILYGGLLERIGWVRVCVDGETWRVRELRGVLETGQRERKRIAARGSW
ncbi:hypothetical protein PMIN03_003671 [Paraphaeosphaeria minitans]